MSPVSLSFEQYKATVDGRSHFPATSSLLHIISLYSEESKGMWKRRGRIGKNKIIIILIMVMIMITIITV